ncbi:hypothetical protein CBR_g8640 [Chara braunii]|uniref:Uncharacterized protein n=1 Tax=Chara braunii TaxID=69332 RepID=A0A388JS30_CHABU|nr:hypothetical protein CBR_g8640 [Chara braunii]|eukprot:GBG60619.1 hypothetical protein CBR_g8640 [Chara braunii]
MTERRRPDSAPMDERPTRLDCAPMNERPTRQDSMDMEEKLRLASKAVTEMRKSSRKSSIEEIVQASGYALGCMAGGYGQALFKFTGKIIGVRFAERLRQMVDLFLGHVGRGCSDARKLTFSIRWGGERGDKGGSLPSKERVEEVREEMAALMKQIKRAVWMAREVERQREEMVRLDEERRAKEGENKSLEESIEKKKEERSALVASLNLLQEEIEERRNAVVFTQELLDMMNARVAELKDDIAALDSKKAAKREELQALKKMQKKLVVARGDSEEDQRAVGHCHAESTVEPAIDHSDQAVLVARDVPEKMESCEVEEEEEDAKELASELRYAKARTEGDQHGACRSSWHDVLLPEEPSADMCLNSDAEEDKRRDDDVAGGFQQYMEFCDYAQRYEVLVGALKHFSGSVLKVERKRVFLAIAELALRQVLTPDNCVQAVKDVARNVEEFGQAQGLGEAVGYLLSREILTGCAVKSLLLCMRVRWVRQEFGVAMLKTFHNALQGTKKSKDKELIKFCSSNGLYFWVAMGGRECPRLRGLLTRKGLDFLLTKF